LRALLLALSLVVAAASPAPAADVTPPSRAIQEAAFMKSVDPRQTANVVTGDLVAFAGKHVAYTCAVDGIVRAGVILGQCGSEAEPMDLFVELPTSQIHLGDRLRVLGVLERPVQWTDLWGHTVYYAFLKAHFVDRIR
jgi:hypothetical protein